MSSSLINYGIPATFLDLISWLHKISIDMDTLNINKPERTQHPRSRSNEMDWTPTVRVNYTKPRIKPY
jgi:hypothetical protein